MKKINCFIPAVFIICCFTGCKTERLSEADLEWMPYKGWETLVFKSNDGETDTLFLLRKDLSTSGRGEMGMNSNYEYVDVDCRHREYWDTEDTAGFGWNTLISISARASGSELTIYFSAKDAMYYGSIYPAIDSLNDVKPKQLSTNYGDYDDVYIFKLSEEDEAKYKERSSYVTKLYWSKSEGLVRYNKKGDEV